MRRSCAINVLLSLVLVFALTGAPLAHAATEADLRAHEKAAADARKAAQAAQGEADRLSREVAALDKTIGALEGDIRTLSNDVATATDRTVRLQAEVDALKAQIVARQAEIDATQAEYEHQQVLLADRVQTTYKNSDFVYFQLLLDSRDIQDLINRTTMVQRVIESNQQIAENLRDARIAIEKAKADVEADMLAVDTKRAEAEAEENRIRGMRAEQQNKLNQQKAAQDKKEALVAENVANAERLRAFAEAEEAESNKIAKLLYGTGSGYFAGVMKFPVPGWEQTPTNGSAFGWRIHPIFGDRRFHAGIDIGSAAVGKSINGASIVAAGDGTVLYAGSRSGYGNTVILDHGNGVTTLYAHQQWGGIRVATGDKVTKGQRIGTVGSTGYSTGPHLHFEVRINGTPADPMNYLK